MLLGPLLAMSIATSAPIIHFEPAPASVRIAEHGRTAPILVDGHDWSGVQRAAKDLRDDIERVTGNKPIISRTEPTVTDMIVVGTLGKSLLIDELVANHKLDLSSLKGKWEASLIRVVPHPWPGVEHALVIAGSDKRGTIYGIYEVSEQAGVSPWYWWADVPTRHHDRLYASGRLFIDSPKVKYRGIFLNDEAPSLTNWVLKSFGDYNHKFYAHVFELLLRLRANYLWPAMWNNCFSEDDPLNPKLADEYGIVMGTSHVEPMMRADKEWNRAGFTADDWNFDKRPDELKKFWAEGIQRNKPYENVVTIAMRGKIDTPMSETANIALLEKIVAAQRQILAEHDLRKTPQLWCLYKEVQEYYEKGMRVPDDVTLLWSDDNWGDIRRLPTAEERSRSGGAGVYYHFDYVGGPRNYKWVNTNPIPKVWEQMNLAYHYGADRVWIVNVGDLKPMEFPMEFFLRMAWNPEAISKDDLHGYTVRWATREFGSEHAEQIASMIERYTRYNGRRKPELLDPSTYSLVNYHEADDVVNDFQALTDEAESLYAKLPENEKAAFYELVLYPTKAACIVNRLYVAAAKNRLYADQGRASTNAWASEVQSLFQADQSCANTYMHGIAGGKWDHMMDQTHVGYTNWQQPDRNNMPAVKTLTIPTTADMGIAVEGSSDAWPGAAGSPVLPEFDSVSDRLHTFDVFNRGSKPFDFAVKASEPWVLLSNRNPRDMRPPGNTMVGFGNLGDSVTADKRIWVGIDWRKVPPGRHDVKVEVSQSNGKSVAVDVIVDKIVTVASTFRGFVESDGCVAIEAEHFTRKLDQGSATWEKIPGYGRTLSGMSLFPVLTPSQTGTAHSPCLEYKMWLFDSGQVNVEAVLGPTLAFQPGRGLRYAIAFDGEKPQIIDAAPKYLSHDWETAVSDSVRKVRSTHAIAKPGEHTLKVWMVDPGIVLERLVVDCGGVKPSYLGPPESARR